jgi:hypothetical protein
VHILGGVEPFGAWWAKTKEITTVKVYPFDKSQVPSTLNGHEVTKPAHFSDFWRFEVMAKEGGIYMDTDHLIMNNMDELLHYTSVWGRQGKNEFGYQVEYPHLVLTPPLLPPTLACFVMYRWPLVS